MEIDRFMDPVAIRAIEYCVISRCGTEIDVGPEDFSCDVIQVCINGNGRD